MSRPPCPKIGVLVVDDDHAIRHMLQWTLKHDGFDVLVAGSGREAIDVYRENRKDIAVVLLDVRMPELDGPQTLDALRELNLEVPACFMSGGMSGYQADELLKRGAARFIPKPFLLHDLAEILRSRAFRPGEQETP